MKPAASTVLISFVFLLQALDPLNKPTFWPHTPEEQLDYDDSKVQEDVHH
jgi:hypothetical protein